LNQIRLDKLISSSLIISRKDAVSVIKSGRVCVDGVVVKKGDIKVAENADIKVDGKNVSYSEHFYIMLNKPAGLISSTDDNREKTVLSLFDKSYADKGLFPCGRLDKDTVGLLIMTTDGSLAHKLLSPKHHAEKLYFVRCDKPFGEEDILLMKQGIMMDGKMTKEAVLEICDDDPCCGRITLTEGKFHEIKRLCYACRQKEVLYLKRLSFGGIELDENLDEGQWRNLTQNELEILKNN